MTNTWLMYFEVAMVPSMAAGAMFLPPAVMISSFLRPVMRRKFWSSI
jgi:hypothetical protein